MLVARPWPEVGTDGISCSVCGPGPHCLGEFHGWLGVNRVHRKSRNLGVVSCWEDIIWRSEGELEANGPVSWGKSGTPDTRLRTDADTVLAFVLICQEDRRVSTGDLSFILPSGPLLVSEHCEGQGLDTDYQLKIHLGEVLRVSLGTDRGRWHFLVGVVTEILEVATAPLLVWSDRGVA